jgi:HEAT repeat protein
VKRALVPIIAVLAGILPGGVSEARQDKFLGKSVPEWRKELHNDDAVVRGNAAFALGKFGPAAVEALPVLVQLLREDKSAGVRDAAALAIGRIARRGKVDAAVLDALCLAVTGDAAPAVKRSAAVALGQCAADTPQVRSALDKALDDGSKGVKQNAAWALGEICAQSDKPPVASLRKALADADKLVKRDAAAALGKLQAKDAVRAAVPDLLACVSHEYLELRKAACFSLVELVTSKDLEAAQVLAKVCKDLTEDPEVRCNAALALSNIGGDSAKIAVPVLHGMLRQGDLDLKRRAALALRNTGEAGKVAENDLIAALKHKDADLRHNAAVALGGLKSTRAVPALVERVADMQEKEHVRVAGAVALLNIGMCDEAVAAVPRLIEVLENPKQPAIVRWRLLWSLRVHKEGLLKYDQLHDAMTKVLTEPGRRLKAANGGKMLRYDCAFLLGVLKGPDAPEEALPVLQEFLFDDSIRLFTTLYIKNSGTGPEIKGPDGKVIERGDQDGRIMAIWALERIGHARVKSYPKIIAQLRAMRDDEAFEPEIRERAGAVLDKWGVK